MKNSKEMKSNPDRMKALTTGDYGTGKSVFARSFPTPGFLFDFDNGAETYRGYDWDYEQFSLNPQGWILFEKTLRALKPEDYKTIVIDSTTTMTDIAMERALQLDPRRDPNTQGPQWNVHYQIVKNLMEGKLRQIISMPVNIVVVCHLMLETDQQTGAILGAAPMLTGQLRNKVPGWFGEVYYAFAKPKGKQTEFVIQTVSKGYYKARSRLSGTERFLPDYIPNNYTALIEHLEEKV